MAGAQPIPWAAPTLYGQEEEMLLDALRSTWISGGPYVDRLEAEMASLLRAPHAIAVSNGTTAIELALRALGLPPGSEVAVPAFGFVAAANMVLTVGLKPVYADIDPETWLLDPRALERVATANTRAVVPIHLYGNVADMDGIAAVAEDAGVEIVEDTAEALFSQYRGEYAGTLGRLGTLSFQATKTITSGEGGMVLTADDRLAAAARKIRDHGMNKAKRYWHDVVGQNLRLTNLQAAVGCGQLQARDRIIASRKTMHEGYVERLKHCQGIKFQTFSHDVSPVVWATVIQLDDDRDVDQVRHRRDRLMAGLAEAGIEVRPGFYDLSQLPPYDCPPLPVAQRVSASTVALPTFSQLSLNGLDWICDNVERQLRL